MQQLIAHILSHPAVRSAVERALASKGVGGDSIIAHITPHEVGVLHAAGGVGTVNPHTGLLQFYPGQGGPAGGDGGNDAGAGDSGDGGYGGQGRGFSGPGGGTMGGAYAGHLGGNVSAANPSGSAGAYGTSGGFNVNPGRIAGALAGLALGPVGAMLGGLGGGWASDALGGNFNIGGTDNRIGAGWGPSGPGAALGPPGANGGGGNYTGPATSLFGVKAQPIQPGQRGYYASTQVPVAQTSTNQSASSAPPSAPSNAGALGSLFYPVGPGSNSVHQFGPNPGLLSYLLASGVPQ